MLEPAYRYKARCERVIDGDTFVALVDLGGDVLARWHLRIAGIDAPELSTVAGPAARMRLAEFIAGGVELIVETRKTRDGADVQSFARFVADVYVRADGANVAELMRAAGAALEL